MRIRNKNFIILKLRKKFIFTEIEIRKFLKKLPITKNLYRNKKLTIRNGSEPYISGDTFRKIADVILKSNSKLSNIVEKKVLILDRSLIAIYKWSIWSNP